MIPPDRDLLYRVAHIEVHDGASLASFLIPRLREIVLQIDRMEGAKALGRRALSTLKGFAKSFNVSVGDIEIGLDLDTEVGRTDSGDIEIDLPELFTMLGQAAADRKTAVAILIDETQ